MTLALWLAGCAAVAEHRVVVAARTDPAAALSTACGTWFDAEADRWTFRASEQPWYQPGTGYLPRENTWAWGTFAPPGRGQRADALRAIARPLLRGEVAVHAYSTEEIMGEVCPGGEPARFCTPARVPGGYGTNVVLVEVVSRGLAWQAANASAVTVEGISVTEGGRTLVPQAWAGVLDRPYSYDAAALASLPAGPTPPERDPGLPTGLPLLLEIVATGGLNLVLRAATDTLNGSPAASPAEEVEVPSEWLLGMREKSGVDERERALRARVLERGCEGDVCRFGVVLGDEGNSPAGGEDAVHLVLSQRWAGCRLVDMVDLPLPPGADVGRRLDGVTARFPVAEGWPGFVPF